MGAPTHTSYRLDWIRAQFEITKRDLTYLNHAGLSPLPTRSRDAMNQLSAALATEGDQAFGEHFESLVHGLLDNIQKMVNASHDEITLVQNTSTGINLIAHSLPLHAGDEVLVCNLEFPSNVYPFMNMASKGVVTRIVEAREGGLTVEAIKSGLSAQTRMVVVSALQFFSGRQEDLHTIGAFCKERGLWLIVDATQAAGLMPLDMQVMHIDALVSGGQKALMGPPGIGFMAIRQALLEQMTPIFASAISVEGWEHWLQYDFKLQPMIRAYDNSTPNLIGMAGLRASMDLLLEIGVSAINEWVSHLSDLAIEELDRQGFQVITPHLHANIVTFAWSGDAKAAAEALKAEGVMLRPHFDATGNGYLRLSSHCYNTEADIISFGKALEKITP
ncbi:MAG: aminotransferase class V-fold PLP-dependent enzyme [Chloroflexi bacterium]|nr:aminotransferase class V-fold PLP-dependent enzyme [Chloroflexota bacterium]